MQTQYEYWIVMKIESISLQNYKVYKDSSIQNLPKMCVFLGPNGSGKSTIFDVFGFFNTFEAAEAAFLLVLAISSEG